MHVMGGKATDTKHQQASCRPSKETLQLEMLHLQHQQLESKVTLARIWKPPCSNLLNEKIQKEAGSVVGGMRVVDGETRFAIGRKAIPQRKIVASHGKSERSASQ